MIRHNILLAYRSFRRFKSTFFINVFGLSVGMACTLLIYLWVMDEVNMDTFHANAENIHQVMMNVKVEQDIMTIPYTPALLAETMAQEMPEVQYAASETPTVWFTKFTLINNTGSQTKATGQFAGKNYFNIFSFDLIQGSKDQVLASRSSIVISEQLAKSLFRTADQAVGKTLECQSGMFTKDFIVSGVFREVPSNSSHQKFDFVLPYEFFKIIFKDELGWDSNGPSTYLLLKDGTNLKAFNRKIADFVKRRYPESTAKLFARPYAHNYLYDKYENGVVVGGRIEYVRIFSIVAAFILLIACINFINLFTAKASRRLREVGVKKVLGAGRNSLITQYLSESVLVASFSLLIALVLVMLFLPKFHEITGKHLALDWNAHLIVTTLLIVLITGVAAGSYPALYLSNFQPAAVLKGKINSSVGEQWARNGLVVFQFTLSVIFIVSVMVVDRQMQFVQNKNLGYDKEHVISIEKEGKLVENGETFLKEVAKIPGVLYASSTSHDMMRHNRGTDQVEWQGKDKNNKVVFEDVGADYDMIEALSIQMKDGRPFSRKFSLDSTAVIFNEAAIAVMGLDNPVGKYVKIGSAERQIVGVVKDFHFESLHQKVKPLFLTLTPASTRFIMVRIAPGKNQETIGQLERLYKNYNPEFALNYKFLDQNYASLYGSEQRVSTLSRYFAIIAIVISCLGLFALASFTAEKRVREISIRKVYGASNYNIIYLLSSSFTKMVLLSVLIATPISFFLTREWLSSFVYKIGLEPWYFLFAGALTLCIAWLTVGMQTVKAASDNPLKSLKDQ
jgi:ABC-type antimicrobial peptide transport system permease subunit